MSKALSSTEREINHWLGMQLRAIGLNILIAYVTGKYFPLDK